MEKLGPVLIIFFQFADRVHPVAPLGVVAVPPHLEPDISVIAAAAGTESEDRIIRPYIALLRAEDAVNFDVLAQIILVIHVDIIDRKSVV